MINNQRNTTTERPLPPPPSEPSVVKQAAELRNWLATLDYELETLHEGLFAPLPERGDEPVPTGKLSLQDLISLACTSAAQAVGFVRTLNGRLGFTGSADQFAQLAVR
jgi:hypothetical protein